MASLRTLGSSQEQEALQDGCINPGWRGEKREPSSEPPPWEQQIQEPFWACGLWGGVPSGQTPDWDPGRLGKGKSDSLSLCYSYTYKIKQYRDRYVPLICEELSHLLYKDFFILTCCLRLQLGGIFINFSPLLVCSGNSGKPVRKWWPRWRGGDRALFS